MPYQFLQHAQGLVTIFFSLYSKKPQGRNLKCQIAIQHFFKIVLYRCLDLIRHNIGTHLKHNKYIFDIPIPFCHNLYLSATLKQFLTEFEARYNCLHHVYLSIPGRIPTRDLIGWLFLGNVLTPVYYHELKVRVAHGAKV
jgi:hypothetical protein